VQSSYAGSIRRCYAATAKKNPSAKPAITIAFHVEPNGTASHVEVVADADFASCVRGKIAEWKFAATAAGLDVRLPQMDIPLPKPETKPVTKPDTKILDPKAKTDPKTKPTETKKPCDVKNGVYNPFDPSPCAR
jgi:hypothetical protein